MLLERLWYSRNPLAWLLLPLSLLFGLIAAARRTAYRSGLLTVRRFAVPVIVVGNISVGGTGKTPLVIWLARHLAALGFRPGVVARGYGGQAPSWPQPVRPDSDPAIVGDEAVLLASRSGCPVWVGPDRAAAVSALLQHQPVDLVISDDGLQHYALGRDLEILVVHGGRLFGNGLLLPAGPLREGLGRLSSVDLVIFNGRPQADGFSMRMGDVRLVPVDGGEPQSLIDWKGRRVHAIAGLGNPDGFFQLLREHGLEVVEHPFPDHHPFGPEDIAFTDGLPVLMTEKDAVKCRRFAQPNHFVVRISAQPDAAFIGALELQLGRITGEGVKHG